MNKPTTIAIAVFGLLLMAGTAMAQVHVQGYYRSDGTYVAPHYRSAPNATTRDNWSVKPNVNPYTGQPGTRNPQTTFPGLSTQRTPYGDPSGVLRFGPPPPPPRVRLGDHLRR